MSGIQNDGGNKISQFYEHIKIGVRSAVDSLKGLVKPKETGKADSKSTIVKPQEGKTTINMPMAASKSEAELTSSTKSLKESLSGDSIADKIKAEADDPSIVKGSKEGYYGRWDDSKGILPKEEILRRVSKDPNYMDRIGTELQQDEEFMAKLFDVDEDKFTETFGSNVSNSIYNQTETWKNSDEFKKRQDIPQKDKLEIIKMRPYEMESINPEFKKDKNFMAQLFDVDPQIFQKTFGNEVTLDVLPLTNFYKDDKIKKEENDPVILKSGKTNTGIEIDNKAKGMLPKEDILNLVRDNPDAMYRIGTGLQQDKAFMMRLYEDNPTKFEERFGQEIVLSLQKDIVK